MHRDQLEQYLNQVLSPEKIKDYCPNGLQVEGSADIKTVVTGVTASQALLNKAVALKADAIVVHHGYFWMKESYVIRGVKHKRIKTLMENDISLFAYHLPLDIHPTLGNNAQLAKMFGIIDVEPLEEGNPLSVAMRGRFETPIDAKELNTLISGKLSRECLHLPSGNNQLIETVAWCSGGGQSFAEQAGELGIDAFISGEVSEKTTHTADEMNIHFFAAGHHATERYGVKALGEQVAKEHDVKVIFVDIDNPV